MGRRIPLALVLVLFVGVAACSGDSTGTESTSETEATESTSESSPPATDASTTAESTTTAPELSVIPGPDYWDPILTTVQAGEAPPAATCPDGTDPDTPGPVDQDRPQLRSVGNRPATFDRHLGRIIYMDVAHETWTFDVCTNTWMNMNPEATGGVSMVVYDVDSDVTVGVDWTHRVWVYDAEANTWSEQDVPTPSPTLDWAWAGVIYDPFSGLILGQTGYDPDSGSEAVTLTAYDVDTNSWTEVGTVEEPNSIVGYSVELDKLVRYQILSNYGDLLDPRTGDIQPLPPTPDFGGGFGVIDYAADTNTAYVRDMASEDICGFDPDTLDWHPCFDPADGLLPRPTEGWGAMVGDPINNRLILINSLNGSWNRTGQDGVWAIDLDTGEWTEILSPSTTGIASMMRPWHAEESAHAEPADAVDEFMDFIGFEDSATQGPFQQGDSRSGEIEIDPSPDFDPGAEFDDVTTVLVRLDSEDNWVVIGSAATGIVVHEPTTSASVSSPLDTHFTHSLITNGVTIQLWLHGAAEPIVNQLVTSGGGIFAMDVWDTTVEWAPPTSGPATAIYTSDNCADGTCELPPVAVAVTAFRVDLTN